MKTLTAKYPGKCMTCGQSFPKGTLIIYSGRGRISHCKCPDATTDPKPSQEDYPCSDMGYEDQCADACGPGL